MGTEGRSTSTAFGRLLREFKREGCSLLLVGQLPEEVRRTARRKLLGSASERRYRLLVTAEGAPSPLAPLDGPARRRARSVAYDVGTRSAAPAPRSTAGAPPAGGGAESDANADPTPVPVDDLDALSDRVSDAIAALERIDGGFGPGELRVGVDSLAPLAAANDDERFRTFLRELTSRVRIARGIGHYVLPVEYGSPAEAAIRGQFDAVLEHRVGSDGTATERWHVPDRGLTTDWIRV